MANAVVLMTALVPTLGHKYLIDFASNLVYDSGGTAHIIVGTMETEPVDGWKRYMAIREAFKDKHNVVVHHLDRIVPQEPDQHPDFWNLWRDIVREFVTVGPDDYFVASELYGMDMARVLGCRFMPCNRYRETLPIKGTDVRTDLLGKFDQILPEFQPYIRKTVTIFGAESCGKTTMARRLAKDMDGWFVPEWAREYLETVGIEITDECMRMIVEGQSALQDTAHFGLHGKPWIFQDTDLLSTVGYYRIYGKDDADVRRCELAAIERGSDLYLVMSDGIPFEPDPIRYGGDVRESNTQFWIDLLDEVGAKYVVVPAGDHDTQAEFIEQHLTRWFSDEHREIIEYRR